MKYERIILVVLVIVLGFGVVTPILLLTLVPDKALAGQLGDALGGTTSPFVNISAILVVLLTYFYQRRNDRKNSEKEILQECISNIKEEVEKVELEFKDGKGAVTALHKGKAALDAMVQLVNDNSISYEELEEFDEYKKMVTIFDYLNSTATYIMSNEYLSDSEKKLFISQLKLHYLNNLYIERDQRGDEICTRHNTRHELPKRLKELINTIETKLEI